MIATINWQYVILRWPSNGVYRVKRRTDGPPPVVDMGADAGTDSWSRTAPPTKTFNGDLYDFAFWSITGQDMLSPQREAHTEFGRTASSSHPGAADMGGGSWVLTAKAFYVRDVGTGPGNHAVLIDAFDVQAGDFLADDFVDVTPDPAHTLTPHANDGYIDTTTEIADGNSINISTRDFLLGNRQFGYWQEIPSLLFAGNAATPPTIGAPDPHDIVAHHNDIIYAFAFYNQLSSPRFKIPYYDIYNPWWWIETHGGLVPPRKPDPQPWFAEYRAVLALAETAGMVSAKLKPAVLEIALQQLSVTATAIKKEMKKGK